MVSTAYFISINSRYAQQENDMNGKDQHLYAIHSATNVFHIRNINNEKKLKNSSRK